MAIRIYPDPLTLLRPVTKVITVTKTRPADTNVYAIDDTVSESTSAGTVWTFGNFARSNGLGGILQSAQLIISTAQALKLDAELWLFDTTPATTLNDNVAWAPTDAELKTVIAVLPFGASGWRTGSGNGITEIKGLSDSIQCATAATSIFGVLRAKNAYIPTSAEDITIRLRCIQD